MCYGLKVSAHITSQAVVVHPRPQLTLVGLDSGYKHVYVWRFLKCALCGPNFFNFPPPSLLSSAPVFLSLTLASILAQFPNETKLIFLLAPFLLSFPSIYWKEREGSPNCLIGLACCHVSICVSVCPWKCGLYCLELAPSLSRPMSGIANQGESKAREEQVY